MTQSMLDRAVQVLNGGVPDRMPLITRLETWYKSHRRTSTLPAEFVDLSLLQVHQALGVGQLKFVSPFAYKLRGVEVRSSFNGQPHFHESEPVIENFPGMWDLAPTDKAGVTMTELVTPRGRLHLRHTLLDQNVLTGTDPYLSEHLIKEDADYRVVEYILERMEFIPRYEVVYHEQEQLGGHGLVVPLLLRIPFQQVLLEYLGETSLFYALHDQPGQCEKLLSLLDEQMTEAIRRLGELKVPYVEFPDNLHGMMTNPRLFRSYCLPAYQRFTQALHAQGKKVGSHTDGDVRLLLALLRESGLDVCESFSPSPLTSCTFTQAWESWRGGPLIWGGLPSPILEERTSEADFESYLEQVLSVTRGQPILWGVVDLFMRHNSIDRMRRIASQINGE